MSITSLAAIAPVLGKGEVECSIHSGSTKKINNRRRF
jgi:hypothetical protein